jgi:transcriptional regulator with XRE-family HTH domain
LTFPVASGIIRHMSDTASAVGATIRRRREAKKLSVHALGRMVGMDASLLSKVERGMVQTTIERYEAIANALGVPLSRLFQRAA